MKFRLKSFSTLQWAMAASLAFHAVLLTVRFIDPEGFHRVFQDSPLEVILVNAKTKDPVDKTEKAKLIAQHSLAGGGDADSGRASSPLPPSGLTELGDANENAARQIEAMLEQQTLLLTQTRKQLASLPKVDPNRPSKTPEAKAQEEKRRQLHNILAEIERRINEENARPKKRYISPATREEVYAIYYDSLRRKIEEKGTENFPNAAGRKLYGELTMVVSVNHDGRVLGVEVAQTSGNLTLDRRAEAIARQAGPFGAFSEAMRRKADQIVVVSRFKFMRDETLQTSVATP